MLSLLAEFIHPNWHIALVHFPIALLVLGVVLEFCSFVSPTLRPAARWMILFGALAGPAVALSGLYALNEVARRASTASNGAWYEVVAGSTLSQAQWTYLFWHAYVQLGATVLALFAACVYLGASDIARRILYLPLLALLLVSALATGFGAHIAGHTVYAHGTAVTVGGELDPSAGQTNGNAQNNNTQNNPTQNNPTQNNNSQNDTPLSTSLPTDPESLAVFLAPPLELHTFLAGVTVSLGCAALACAFRNTSLARMPAKPARANSRTSDLPPASDIPLLAASRLLLLTTLTGAIAATAGWWNLAHESETYKPKDLYEIVVPFAPKDIAKPEHRDELRRPIHVAVGVLLITLPLLLSFWVRLRPHGRFLLTLATLAFLTTAAAQTALGSLLLFDEVTGPLAKLASPDTPPPPTSAPSTEPRTE